MLLENQVRRLLSYLVLSVLILASSVTPSLAEQRKLTFCGDVAGWPPYTYELNGEVYGYDIDILEKILTPLEIDFKVYMLPWKRCLKLVEGERIDVVLSASGTQERENNYRVTTKYYSVDPHFFILEANFLMV